jgi:hypothetical protein
MSKKQPTGFVATCQCGAVVGAMNYASTNGEEAGHMIAAWLMGGCTVEPRFGDNWSCLMESCRCKKGSTE